METNDLFIFWSVIIVVSLSLDALGYFVLRHHWKRSGGIILTDDLWAQISGRLQQRARSWQEKRPVKSEKPVIRAIVPEPSPAPPLPPSPPLREEPAVQVIPASVKTLGQLREVEFSVDIPLNTVVDIYVGAASEDGVKVEKREL